jgi:tetratricopeptide (TPR) repeat protein
MRRNLAISLGLVLITLAAYARVGWLDFVSVDDQLYVSDNPYIEPGLTWDHAAWAFTTHRASNWHPLTWLSLMLDSTCFGMRPAGYHLVNLAMHAASAVTLFLVLCRMTGAAWPSALVAALFAVHPLHVESVAWIAERKDVLSTLLGLLALAAYVGYARRPGVLRYVLVFLLLALGLLAKPMLVTLPLVFLLLDYWPLRRWPAEIRQGHRVLRSGHASPAAVPPFPQQRGWWLLVEKIPLIVLAAASSIVTYHVQQTGGAVVGWETMPLTWRLENALVSYVIYMGQTLWPRDLAVFYPFFEAPATAWVLAAAAVLAACSAAAAWGAWRGHRWLAVGWTWYLGMLVPVIGLVQVGGQARADRYTYLPLVGLFIVFAWGAAGLAARWRLRPRVAAPAAAALLLACMLCTAAQVQHWANTETLFTHAVAVTGDNPMACDNVAAYLWQHGRWQEAGQWWSKSLAVHSADRFAMQGLVLVLIKEGRSDEAARQAEQVLRLYPDADALHNALAEIRIRQGKMQEAMWHLQHARNLQPENINVLHNIAEVHLLAGQLDAAAECWLEILRLRPGNVAACNNLACVRMRQGRLAEAEELFRRSLKREPNNSVAGNNLATIEAMQGNYQEAVAGWSAMLANNPRDQAALNALAWALATSPEASIRDGKRAVSLAQQALDLCELREPNALDTLAAACAEAGRFPEAIRAADEAVTLARRQGNAGKEAEFRGRLELYRRGHPFRDVAPQAGLGLRTP